MSDYCALSDVQVLLSTLPAFSGTTVPSEAQAEALITTCRLEIDGVLRAQGYDLPLTDTGMLAYLSAVNSYGAAALILKAKFPADAGAGGDRGASTFWKDRYDACLESIRAGALGSTEERATRTVAHGFRDSEGTALCDSTLITPVSRETEF